VTHQQNDQNAGNEELEDNHEASAETELVDITIHARQHISTTLTDGDDHTENWMQVIKDVKTKIIQKYRNS
jgi:hypothetical protein